MRKMLFMLARKPFLGKITGFILKYAPFAVPVSKVYKSKQMIGFYHPVPSYQNHIVIVPRKIIMSVSSLSDDFWLSETVRTAESIVEKSDLFKDDYVLCVNGGKRQDVKQLHFHLFDGNIIEREGVTAGQLRIIDCGNGVTVQFAAGKHSSHLFVLSQRDIFAAFPVLDASFALNNNGYTLIYQFVDGKRDGDTVYLVS